jgi:hypothetical protein
MGVPGMGSGGELNISCPAITPTVGPTELLTNPGFETAGAGSPDVFAQWSETVAGASTINDETTVIHGGSHACRMDIDGSNSNAQITAGVLTTHKWYQYSLWAKAASGTPTLSMGVSIANYLCTLSTTYQQFMTTQRAPNANLSIFRSTATSNSLYIDDTSCQEIAFATMHAKLGQRLIRPGTYTCHPTVAAGTCAGMLISYLNDSNFVMALIYNGLATVYVSLLSCAAGTYTAKIAYSTISYTAAAELKVVINASNYSLFYKGIQIGTTQAIDDSGMGLEVHGWTTYAANSVGQVTTGPGT